MYRDFWGSDHSDIFTSSSESRRFGRVTSRFNVGFDSKLTNQEIASICSKDDSDLLFMRAPSSRFELGDHLSRIEEKRVLQADTLLYFSLDVPKFDNHFMHTSTDFELRQATSDDHLQLQDLVKKTFDGYSNHYSANLDIDNDQMLDGYLEWANSLAEKENHYVFIRKSTDEYLDGFLVIEFQGREIELVIGGTHPLARRTGSYFQLWNKALSEIGVSNVDFIRTSTQTTNLGVINSWIKSGFTYSGSVNTFHVIRKNMAEGGGFEPPRGLHP